MVAFCATTRSKRYISARILQPLNQMHSRSRMPFKAYLTWRGWEHVGVIDLSPGNIRSSPPTSRLSWRRSNLGICIWSVQAWSSLKCWRRTSKIKVGLDQKTTTPVLSPTDNRRSTTEISPITSRPTTSWKSTTRQRSKGTSITPWRLWRLSSSNYQKCIRKRFCNCCSRKNIVRRPTSMISHY